MPTCAHLNTNPLSILTQLTSGGANRPLSFATQTRSDVKTEPYKRKMESTTKTQMHITACERVPLKVLNRLKNVK